MKLVKLAGLSLCAGVAVLAFPAAAQNAKPAEAQQPAAAQPAKPQLTLDQVLQAVRKERSEASAENKAREQRFLQNRNEQQAQLNQVKAQVAAAAAESTRLEGVMKANQDQIDKLDQELAEKQGQFQELFGAARSAAADLTAQLQKSVISAEYPGREKELQQIAQTDTLPTESQLRYLWETMIQQIVEQGKVATFTANVAQPDGTSVSKQITRIGPFDAFADGKYLVYNSQQNQLQFLARQPTSSVRDAARRVASYKGDGFVRGVIDPSLGTLLGLIVEEPSLKERINQGGSIGYLTIGLGVLAFVWGIFKWFSLSSTASAVRAQVRKQKPSKNNPLGRVMLAYEAVDKKDPETVQLALDDAILREIPKIEGGLNLIRIISTIAPLLGLLGTVVGMVITFQSITLFGTGDPKIMANGISVALMTTVIGLVTAIPLVLLYAFTSGAANNIIQILEEQAAGVVAETAGARR
ncbi:MAG: MotA/TolQ/ExbB proton channel family protein [Alphaproteobacteria bacterium]|nr:MotA/TolQ/ExbB proton channel family protein [Alphaproteobacteria bacterium]